MKTYSIEHKQFPPRGNVHGYTAFDYARDLVNHMNSLIGSRGISPSKQQVERLLLEESTEEQRADYGLVVIEEEFAEEE